MTVRLNGSGKAVKVPRGIGRRIRKLTARIEDKTLSIGEFLGCKTTLQELTSLVTCTVSGKGCRKPERRHPSRVSSPAYVRAR